jgi:hypothetical protein
MIRGMLMASAVMVFALSLMASPPARAASSSVREACHDDAEKFCASVISDTGKRRACMKAHVDQLSKGCIAALKAAK